MLATFLFLICTKGALALNLDPDLQVPAPAPVWHFMQAPWSERIVFLGNIIASSFFYTALFVVLLGIVIYISKNKKLLKIPLIEIVLWLLGLSLYIFAASNVGSKIVMHYSGQQLCIDYCTMATKPDVWYAKLLFLF